MIGVANATTLSLGAIPSKQAAFVLQLGDDASCKQSTVGGPVKIKRHHYRNLGKNQEISSSRSIGFNFKALAMRTRFLKPTFRSPRSMPPMYVQ
jgi:hypothetical protein